MSWARPGWVLAMITLLGRGCGPRAANPRPPARPAPVRVSGKAAPLIDVGAGADPSIRYTLLARDCAVESTTCAWSLEVRRAGALLTSLPAVWNAAPTARPIPAEAIAGLGDPLGTPRGWTAVRAEGAAGAADLGARIIALDDDHEGVWLHAVSADGSLDRLWVRTGSSLREYPLEGIWSDVHVSTDGRKTPRLIRFERRASPAYSVAATQYVWDPTVARWSPSRTAPVYLAVYAVYGSLDEARDRLALGTSERRCWGDAAVATTDLFEGLPPGHVWVGQPTADRALADQAIARVRRCSAAIGATVIELRHRWSPLVTTALGDGRQAQLGRGEYDGRGWPLQVRQVASPSTTEGAGPIEVGWPLLSTWVHPASESTRPATATGGNPAPEILIGEENTAASVTVRMYSPAPDAQAWLVSMSGGFEHLKSTHDVIILSPGPVRRGYRAEDPQGPATSTMGVQHRTGADVALHTLAFEGSEAGLADTLAVSRLDWDRAGASFRPDAGGCVDDVSLVVWSRHRTLPDALAEKRACRTAVASDASLVLEASAKSATPYARVSLARDRGQVQSILGGDRCAFGGRPVVIPWCAQAWRGSSDAGH